MNEHNDASHYGINISKTTTRELLEYKTKIKGITPKDNNRLDVAVVVL